MYKNEQYSKIISNFALILELKNMSMWKFLKRERLCSQKIIGELFKSGNTLKQFPFKLVYSYSPRDRSPVKIAISVPKKIHKRAVKRNFIRRRIKEVYRLNKHLIHEVVEQKITLNIIVVYISPNIASYAEIEKKFTKTMSILVERVKKDIDIRPVDSD
jgi:ribonuclease P protein component